MFSKDRIIGANKEYYLLANLRLLIMFFPVETKIGMAGGVFLYLSSWPLLISQYLCQTDRSVILIDPEVCVCIRFGYVGR